MWGILLLLNSLHLIILMPCLDEGHFQKGGFLCVFFQKVILTSSWLLCRLYVWQISFEYIWRTAVRKLILIGTGVKTCVRLNSITSQKSLSFQRKWPRHVGHPSKIILIDWVVGETFFKNDPAFMFQQISPCAKETFLFSHSWANVSTLVVIFKSCNFYIPNICQQGFNFLNSIKN